MRVDKDQAVFASLSFDITDALEMTVGARFFEPEVTDKGIAGMENALRSAKALGADVVLLVPGLVIGIPLLFSVNVFRLATLARSVEVYPQAFFYFHEYVWQGIFMVFVLVGSLAWAERYG